MWYLNILQYFFWDRMGLALDGVVSALAFNIRTDKQPGGGFSVVVVFEPQITQEGAQENADLIAERLRDLGWNCERTQ